jgi:orotate phosphoribosyltransferase
LSDYSDFSRALHKGLVRHLVEHAVRTDGPFTLASGAVSDWYIDARQTTFDGRGSVLVARCVLEAMHESVTVVGGMTMGADPIAVATAVVAGLEDRSLGAFSIRKQAKDHGAGGRLVGPVTLGDRAMVVEDTTTTGATLADAISVLRDEGVGVVQALAVVDRSGGAAADVMAATGVPYIALVTPADLGVTE